MAVSLKKLQTRFGLIPNLKSKGVASKKILQKLQRMRTEEESAESSTSSLPARSEIDTIVMYVNLFDTMI